MPGWLPSWTNMLSPWGWAAVLAVPPAILALYFLRLKRSPLEVPSTYLWRKSIEDLHVNSLWQRLRQSILLLLQLLLVGLVILALLRPNWQGTQLSGGRYIFLVDNSASMAATDVQPTRLAEAKRQVMALIEKMASGDKAMIISFADRARVEQAYTDNRKQLRERLTAIEQTARPTSLVEALNVASGLANPGRSATDITDTQVAEALPAQVFIFSDGRFADVEKFSLGNLAPVYVPVGAATAENLAIAAFSTKEVEGESGRVQAFASIESHASQPRETPLELYLDGELIDASRVTVAAGESAGVAFDLDSPLSGVLELRAATGDDLKLDDAAWAALNPPRRARVLVVEAGPNPPLAYALATESARKLADVTTQPAAYLKDPEYQQRASAGECDLVIYDRTAPAVMPQANTLFIGSLPPVDWKAEAKADVPQIVDIDRAHPLMQFLELGDVIISEGTPLTPPGGASVLIHGSRGPLFAIAPRQAFEDAVLGFEPYSADEVDTNWPVRLSFPVFVLNVLEYLGGQAQGQLRVASTAPGSAVTLRLDGAPSEITIHTPRQGKLRVSRTPSGVFRFADTDALGAYTASAGDRALERFTVNLFSAAESDIRPRAQLKIGHVEVQGSQQAAQTTRREAWKWLVLAGLVVLLVEWYIYNRRVYL
ncbi:MAG: BatA and WFA domain-containing protein [Pirellulales bacterium]|nr:BatA and WFA domain-containing protein [Pirellulales bacterium]